MTQKHTFLLISRDDPKGYDAWSREAETLEDAVEMARRGMLLTLRACLADARDFAPNMVPAIEQMLADERAYMDDLIVLTARSHPTDSPSLDLMDVTDEDVARLEQEAPKVAAWLLELRATPNYPFAAF